MSTTERNAAEIADLVLQLGRAAYADCSASGLTQAQWIAVRFFSRANRFSRTVSGFAEFHGTTRGTASQTVKALVDRGYLERTRSEKDARSVRFDVTGVARRKMRQDPLVAVEHAAGSLQDEQRSRVTVALRTMLQDLDNSRRQPGVGVCRLCRHLDRGGAGRNARCRLMQEPLADTEFEQLCVRYQAVE